MKLFLFSLLSTFLLFLAACNKRPSGGYGGNANLKLVARHHGNVIDSITFYVKFNATDAPALESYDVVKTGTTLSTGNTYAVISGLKKGKYYIYAKGWDPFISSEISGGIPYSIEEEMDLDIIVAVTETH
ncbi:hypothetical protein EMGBS15_16770 [Filimonas sp.]|nr:hypothetical protein EMGBS15_16770 [Filimonas sp.]